MKADMGNRFRMCNQWLYGFVSLQERLTETGQSTRNRGKKNGDRKAAIFKICI
jgi:hypothetical protein